MLVSDQKIYHSNSTITDDFLATIESELSDETLQKELKKITRSVHAIQKKEEKLVTMRLENQISEDVYQGKYREIVIEKERSAEEKINVEITLKSELDVKQRLHEFKCLLNDDKMLMEFDRTVFESIVEKIIVGGVNDDGEIDPAMLTIIFKTGNSTKKDAKKFKSKRKNAKIVTDELCSQSVNEDKKMYLQDVNNAY